MLNKLRIMLAKSFGTGKYVNKEYIQLYLDEVRGDIKSLKSFNELPFEERQREHNQIYFGYFFDKYRKDYCPSAFYELFDFDNQIKYLELRTQIDDILRDSPL